MAKKLKTKVHIFIPTFNSSEDMVEMVKQINRQVGDYEKRILIIDSSIEDKYQKQFKKLKVIDFRIIDNCEFSHGGTRAKAIEIALKEDSEFIVFTVQDAQIVDKFWLSNMLTPFELDPLIACVYGKQIPYPNHSPLAKQWMKGAFDSMSEGDELEIHSLKEKDKPATFFNSHVNSSYRLKFFKEGKLKMPNITYAEDQHLAKELINKGFLKVYNPKAAVYHSHSWDSPYEYFQRFFDEYRGLEVSIGYFDKNMSIKNIIRNTFHTSREDVKGIISGNYSFIQKIIWSIKAFPIEYYKGVAIYLGGRHKEISQDFQNILSKEDMQKNLKKKKPGIFLKVKANIIIIYLQCIFYFRNKR